ncbi:MAG: hypothetical protein AAF628_09295 [Planctomycetota bacterium]
MTDDPQDRFLDALLHRAFSEGRADDDHRVAAALARIDRRSAWPRRFVSRALPTLAAAGLAAVALIFATGPATLSAQEVVERSMARAALLRDRAYDVRIETRFGREVEGELFVRGNERIVLHFETPRGSLWAGYDGEEAWVVPRRPRAPVLVSSDPARIESWLAERGPAHPFLQVDALLERLRNYDLQDLSSGQHLVVLGQRNATSEERGPDTLELTARAGTGEIESLTLKWERRGPLRRVELRLRDEAPRADGFYGHATHHDPGRRVLRR